MNKTTNFPNSSHNDCHWSGLFNHPSQHGSAKRFGGDFKVALQKIGRLTYYSRLRI